MPNQPLNNEKDSFVMHYDKAALFLLMTDELAGRIIKAITLREQHNHFDKEQGEYYNDFGPCFESGSAEEAYFNVFANMLDANTRKWLEKCKTSRNNGLKGGRPSKPDGNPTKPLGNPTVTHNNPTLPDKDKDKEKEKDKDKDIIKVLKSDNEIVKSILDYMTDDEFKDIEAHCQSTKAVTDRIDDLKGVSLDKIRNHYSYFKTVAKEMGLWDE